VEHIELLMSKEVPGQNRGFGFVEFYNHTCANAAKGVLSAPSYRRAPAARRRLNPLVLTAPGKPASHRARCICTGICTAVHPSSLAQPALDALAQVIAASAL